MKKQGKDSPPLSCDMRKPGLITETDIKPFPPCPQTELEQPSKQRETWTGK